VWLDAKSGVLAALQRLRTTLIFPEGIFLNLMRMPLRG
jgi:hypothetical protein